MKTIINVPVVNESKNQLPEYETSGASGMDLRADLSNVATKFLFDAFIQEGKLYINPGGRALIPTGLHIGIPEGFEMQVRPRSGLALKKGITIVNTPGTIDADYTGNIGVILRNEGVEQFVVENGDRIAQGVFTPVATANFIPVSELKSTDRGGGGYGHTNIK